ncbi:hypothetical protein ACWCXH_28105 [Kitasatospora sp. NPDC001660]
MPMVFATGLPDEALEGVPGAGPVGEEAAERPEHVGDERRRDQPGEPDDRVLSEDDSVVQDGRHGAASLVIKG